MMARILYTAGNGEFIEGAWDMPVPGPTEILVKAVMTGVCRSDIDMMQGKFPLLPVNMSGHEGLGQVVDFGKDVSDVLIGEYVATRGEPAYADYYTVRKNEYVVVPGAHQRYILEPVACGVNCVLQAEEEIKQRSGPGARLLILGSGFLAWVAYHTILASGLDFDVTVMGNSNRSIWGDRLSQVHAGVFDVVIDLSSHDLVFQSPVLKPQGLLILGAQKTVTTDFSNLLWNAVTVIFPSPRTDKFYRAMVTARDMIQSKKLSVDMFWSKLYNRDTEWADAFSDAVSRPAGYSRGAIYWPNT